MAFNFVSVGLPRSSTRLSLWGVEEAQPLKQGRHCAACVCTVACAPVTLSVPLTCACAPTCRKALHARHPLHLPPHVPAAAHGAPAYAASEHMECEGGAIESQGLPRHTLPGHLARPHVSVLVCCLDVSLTLVWMCGCAGWLPDAPSCGRRCAAWLPCSLLCGCAFALPCSLLCGCAFALPCPLLCGSAFALPCSLLCGCAFALPCSLLCGCAFILPCSLLCGCAFALPIAT